MSIDAVDKISMKARTVIIGKPTDALSGYFD